MPASLELQGKTFGRLLVLARDGRTNAGKIRWLCQCSCNPEEPVEVIVIGSKLVGGHTRSCGCIQREAAARTGNRFKHLLIPGDRRRKPKPICTENGLDRSTGRPIGLC